MTHQPTMFNERIHELDSIRGVALLGILLMNIMSFAGAYIDISTLFMLPDIFQGESNQLTLFLINTFVTTNFYTLFSILFGLGFFIFLDRARDKTRSPNRLYFRRMTGLLIIGLIHAIFIWYGDILVSYALVGFTLIMFIKLPPKWNMGIAIGISIVMTSLILLLYFLMNKLESVFIADDIAQSSGIVEIARSGSYLDIIIFNSEYLLNMFVGLIFTFPVILMMFLIGLYIGQKGYHKRINEIKPFLLKVAVISLVIGLPIKVLTAFIESYRVDNMALMTLTAINNSIGGPLMAIFYLSVFAILFNSFKGLNHIFAPVGRMALTNYIMQSVVMLILFYGFKLFGKIDMVYLPTIAITFFIIQVIYSRWYMKRFRFGPIEYLWRRFTYKTQISIRNH